MVRIASIVLIILSCGIGLTWGQTDTPDSRPASGQRGMRTMTPGGAISGQGDTSTSPAKPAEISPSRPSAQVAPPVAAESVSVIPTKQGENGYTRIICKLSNFPAANVSTFLDKLFQAEGKSIQEDIKTKVVIMPETVSNCLLISGPPTAVKEVQDLVREIDQPPPMVRLEVQMTEMPVDKGKKAGDSVAIETKTVDKESTKKTTAKNEEGTLLIHAEACTLNNQTLLIKDGRQEPRITSVSQNQMGGRNNAISVSNMGTTIHLTPRISPDGTVAVQLDIEDNRSGPMEEGVVITELQDRQVRSPNIETLTYQSTLRLQDGRPMMIYGTTNYGKTRQIAVTAHIIYPGAK
jgi:type II secretory pathway component GspD/PulD (secretin)